MSSWERSREQQHSILPEEVGNSWKRAASSLEKRDGEQ